MIAIGLLAGSTALARAQAQLQRYDSITKPALLELLGKEAEDFLLIDVRRPEEYREGHLPGARNHNVLDSLGFETAIKGYDRAVPVYLYCRSGRRSKVAVERLRAAGFASIIEYTGGYLDWVAPDSTQAFDPRNRP